MTVCLILLWLVAPLAFTSAETPSSQGQDPLGGARIFRQKGCLKCHAVRGLGGTEGPDLARVHQSRSLYDLAAAMWNHLPRMTARMQQLGISRPALEAGEAADLIAFLYTLDYFDPPGDFDAGQRVFQQKRCITCHQIRGTGGLVGPNLDAISSVPSAISIASAMWNHGAGMTARMRERGIDRPVLTAADFRHLLAFLAPDPRGLEGRVYVLPGRAAEGLQLFASKKCIACHRVAGQGGQGGPDLADRARGQSLLEFAATMWNKRAAMSEAVKARGIELPQLRPEETADIVAYLYSVRYFPQAGNAGKGAAIAGSPGCRQCHAGRDTAVIRATGPKSVAAVTAALWNHVAVPVPASDGPKTVWPSLTAGETADLAALLNSPGPRR